MRSERTLFQATGLLTAPLLLLAGLSACSSSSLPNDGAFYVESCSLGCTPGATGAQISCSVRNTFQNQEISILFSEPIDLFSVNSSTFQVVDISNGTSPPGQFFSDPINTKRLIFRPALSFDQNGNPIYGLKADTAYELRIPGQVQDVFGPFIQSVTGRPNQARMQCTIQTSKGIIDPVPGAPSVVTSVDVVTGYDSNGNADQFDRDVVLSVTPEIQDVWRLTRITFFFNDVMNVATLLDPASKTSPFISVEVDPDGDLATLDRFDVDGEYSFGVDLNRLETFLYFDAFLPFPSAGPQAPMSPRRIVVTIPPSVQDLVANSVGNGAGVRSFVPELSKFGESLLPPGGEDFMVSWPAAGSNEDGNRSGAFWGGGRLVQGIGGGSGRLGDLVVPSGLSLVLSTDSQTFPLTTADGYLINRVADLLGNPDPVNFPNTLGNFPDSITVTDGVFEFSSLTVQAGGSLRFVGNNPARIYVRGPVDVQTGGLIDMSGAIPADHDSTVLDPLTQIPTPINAGGGGDGGYGGTRFDMSVNAPMAALTACENDPVLVAAPHTGGYQGMGVGRAGKLGGGQGGVRYPVRYPILDTQTVGSQEVGFNVTTLFDPFTLDTECRSLMVGGSGGGGAYATAGAIGIARSVQDMADWPIVTNNAPDTPGGDPSEVGLEPPAEDNVGYAFRTLRWFLGELRGGSGGGGGGSHPFGAWADGHNGSLLNDCVGPLSLFFAWMDHSGARGGFGGGALHLASGKRITLNGQIDASGGRGGEPRSPIPPPSCPIAQDLIIDYGKFATPGGGGSGGAVKLQSIVVTLAPTAGVIDVSGGLGGTAKAWANSRGGDGGAGLVRIEDIAGLSRAQAAPSVLPFDPVDNSLSWLSVDDGQNPLDGPGWVRSDNRPDAFTGTSSCWLSPQGNVSSVFFVVDEADVDTGTPAQMGWNMDLLYRPGGGPQVTIPFRGQNAFLMQSWETTFGKNLGTEGGTVSAAPVVVRFQGARATGSLDYCNLDINDPTTTLVAGSVTPWVDHPALLNNFQPPPNIVRFVVVYDDTRRPGDSPRDVLSLVDGVNNFWIRVVPD